MRRALLWTLGALVLAEGLLQLVAWRVWSTEWVGPQGTPVPGRVLLVGAGEVFDEGVLLRGDAWPAAVERRLREAGIEAAVVNGASPGRDSADVLARLPLQLTLERPSVVGICVGIEDVRQRAAEAIDPSALAGRNAPFPRRLRLPAFLLAPFRRSESAGDERADDRAFVGPWHFGDVEFVFEPDGDLQLGGVGARWREVDDRLVVEIPGGDPVPVDWRLDGDRLELVGPFPGGRVEVLRGHALPGPAARARVAMQRGDLDEAEWLLVPAVRGSARDPDAVPTLIELLARLGRDQEARDLLVRLEREPATDPAAHARQRARAHVALGEAAAAVALIEPNLAAHLQDPVLLASLRTIGPGPATARLADAAERALAAAPAPTRRPLAWLLADLQSVQGAPTAALRTAVLGLAATGAPPDPSDVPRILRSVGPRAIAALSQNLDLPVAEAGNLLGHAVALDEADQSTAAVLEHNLLHIIELVRFFGAEPVILDPADDPLASRVRAAVADRTGATLVACTASRSGLTEATFAVLAERLRSR